MKYENVREAVFLERPNRFIARCRLMDGTVLESHVPNTGRCRELLVPGYKVYLRFDRNPKRRTPCSLIAVDKGGLLINMDSQAPNRVVEEALLDGSLSLTKTAPSLVRREFFYHDSRLDFCLEAPGQRVYLEVKGVTLEQDGVVRFPDAPTQRGLRHIRELERAAGEGFDAAVVFVVQMERALYFAPNDDTQPEFGFALRSARSAGVRLLAYLCAVTPEEIRLGKEISVKLQ